MKEQPVIRRILAAIQRLGPLPARLEPRDLRKSPHHGLPSCRPQGAFVPNPNTNAFVLLQKAPYDTLGP